MNCFIYKGRKATDTYLYLASEDDFASVPEPLRDQLGSLEKVMELELTPDRRLAQADTSTVLAALESRGFYLQMPPPKEILLANDRLLR